MYRIESAVYDKNEWQVETLPMPLSVADYCLSFHRFAEKLYRSRVANATGARRFRLVKVK